MDNLEKIEGTSNNKNLALLAQEMRFMHSEFTDFKTQTAQNFQDIKANTSGNYAPRSQVDDHERRIARLEKAALWVLGTTFSIVFLAIIGLVVIKRGP